MLAVSKCKWERRLEQSTAKRVKLRCFQTGRVSYLLLLDKTPKKGLPFQPLVVEEKQKQMLFVEAQGSPWGSAPDHVCGETTLVRGSGLVKPYP